MNKFKYILILIMAIAASATCGHAQDDEFNWTALDDIDEAIVEQPVEAPAVDDLELDVDDLSDELEADDVLDTQPVALPEPVEADEIVEAPVEDAVPAEVEDVEVEVPAEPVAVEDTADEPLADESPIADSLDLGEDFTWEDDAGTSAGDTQPATAAADTKASEAYGELLRENLELRKRIGELGEVAESAQKAVQDAVAEKEQLVDVVKGLEQTLDDMTAKIAAIKNEQKNSTENLDKTVELQQQLASAEKEKAALMNELAAARAKATAKDSTVKEGSDLFKQVQEDNAKLKDKLVELETARMAAEKRAEEAARIKEQAEQQMLLVKEKEDKLEDELKEVREKDKDRRKVIEKMLKQIPDLEKELVKLNADVEAKESALDAREKDLELLRSELQKRDHRFVKAERMAELLEEAREEVKMVSNIEKRDMHYNMAVVYAKEGRALDAEREYLRALKLDPTDPAVHYNLGILYEDELNKIHKAVLHYKKYIQLAPFAKDVDTVKQWLIDIEMRR